MLSIIDITLGQYMTSVNICYGQLVFFIQCDKILSFTSQHRFHCIITCCCKNIELAIRPRPDSISAPHERKDNSLTNCAMEAVVCWCKLLIGSVIIAQRARVPGLETLIHIRDIFLRQFHIYSIFPIVKEICLP